jgi:hypothetical protein
MEGGLGRTSEVEHWVRVGRPEGGAFLLCPVVELGSVRNAGLKSTLRLGHKHGNTQGEMQP